MKQIQRKARKIKTEKFDDSTYQPWPVNVHRMKIHPVKSYGNLSHDHVANRRASNDHRCHRQMSNRDCAATTNCLVRANVFPTKYPNRNHRTESAMHCPFDVNATMCHQIQTSADSFWKSKKENETKFNKRIFQIARKKRRNSILALQNCNNTISK